MEDNLNTDISQSPHPPPDVAEGPWQRLLDHVPLPDEDVGATGSADEDLTPSEELRRSGSASNGEVQRLLALVAGIFFLTTLGLSVWVYNLERPAPAAPEARLNIGLFTIPQAKASAPGPIIPAAGDKILVLAP